VLANIAHPSQYRKLAMGNLLNSNEAHPNSHVYHGSLLTFWRFTNRIIIIIIMARKECGSQTSHQLLHNMQRIIDIP